VILLGFESPLEHQKISSPFGGEIFSGRSRGVEVYPRQGKSPLEHQKISLAFWRGDFFRSRPGSRSLSPAGEIPAGAPKIFHLKRMDFPPHPW